MWVKTINEMNISLPEWITWIDWTEYLIVNKDDNIVKAHCEKTKLFVSFVVENHKIQNFACDSLMEDWGCMSSNWPEDEEWNRICNIKI